MSPASWMTFDMTSKKHNYRYLTTAYPSLSH